MAWYDSLVSPFRTPTYTGSDADEELTGYDYDIGKIISAGSGALTLGQQAMQLFGGSDSGSNRPTGYQGSIPTYTATRTQVPNTYDPNRRPGSGGQRHFTDVNFGGGDPTAEATGLAALNRANLAAQNRQGQQLAPIRAAEDAAAAKAAQQPAQQLAAGGIASLKEGKYLDGATDGMADEKPAMIDDEQPAALSDGEFVIPADVVSHLGNGNSDAGAKVLEDMMARVRKERTGSTKQGKEINPEEFLPV